MAIIKFDVERFKKEFYKSDEAIAHAEKLLKRPLSDFFDHYLDNIYPKIKSINENITKDVFLPLMNPEIDVDVLKATKIHINSVKSRVKNPYHLIDKLVRKINKNTDYAEITLDNYHLYVDDLIGFRVLLLYLEDWYDLHQKLLTFFPYSKDRIVNKQDRSSIPNQTPSFMIGIPEINIRNGDDEDIYKVHFRNCCFDDLFLLRKGRYYRSIHYSIYHQGFCFEIQVRSLFDEAWSEVDHDVLYPLYLDHQPLVDFSKQINRLAGLGNEMTSYFRGVLKNSVVHDNDTDKPDGTLDVVPNVLAMTNHAFDAMNETQTDDTGSNSSYAIVDDIIKEG